MMKKFGSSLLKWAKVFIFVLKTIMYKNLLTATCFVFVLFFSAKAQESSNAKYLKTVNSKLPASIQNFSFDETYGTFNGRQIDHEIDTLSKNSIKASFLRNYKDISKMSIVFVNLEDDYMFNSATAQKINVEFINAAAKASYLKKLGKPTGKNTWTTYTFASCMGVSVEDKGGNKVEIKLFNECAG